LFHTEASRLEAEGAQVTKVVLDYELKREYHTFVARQENARPDIAATNARRIFAEQNDLPFLSGRIQFPDVRIEYESEDGRECHRDLELATEHYSRSQIGGKQRAGFRVYRAAGAGANSGRGTQDSGAINARSRLTLQCSATGSPATEDRPQSAGCDS
jgi:hypothetical protein